MIPLTDNFNRKPSVVLFTSDRPRHFYLIQKLAADRGIRLLHTFVQPKNPSRAYEVTYSHSELMTNWISQYQSEELECFPEPTAGLEHMSKCTIVSDINNSQISSYLSTLHPDYIVVFGTGLVKEPITAHCTNIINIHLGMSPFYRGTATTLWPYINNEPEFLGATVLSLDSGIDSGDIFHVVLPNEATLIATPNITSLYLTKKAIDSIPSIIHNRCTAKYKQDLTLGKLYLNKNFTPEHLMFLSNYLNSENFAFFLSSYDKIMSSTLARLKRLGIPCL
jgi:phosphoribosylglycinamide formyltransferase-1